MLCFVGMFFLYLFTAVLAEDAIVFNFLVTFWAFHIVVILLINVFFCMLCLVFAFFFVIVFLF